MNTLNITLPESLHKNLFRMAEMEGISISHFVSLAVAEKMSALLTLDYLEQRAAQGSREKFEAVLAKVPDIEPEEYDRFDE